MFFARSIHGADILEHQSFQHTNLTPPMRARVVFIIFSFFSPMKCLEGLMHDMRAGEPYVLKV